MARKNNLITDYGTILLMNKQAQINLSEKLAKRANTRLKALEKAGFNNDTWAYGKAMRYLNKIGRKTFYRGKDFEKSGINLKRHLQELTYFLNADTSTLSGIKKMNQKRAETFLQNTGLVERLQERDGLSKKEIVDKYKDDYYNFISSAQFKEMSKRIDSNQIVDDFAKALEQGYTLEEIQQQYLEENVNEVTFDKIQEKYNRAIWHNNGGLMK